MRQPRRSVRWRDVNPDNSADPDGSAGTDDGTEPDDSTVPDTRPDPADPDSGGLW